MKTHRKDGTPTAYGFACGHYLKKIKDDKEVTLDLVDCVFRIKSIDWSKQAAYHAAGQPGFGSWNDPQDFRKWKTATTIHEARRIFRMECKRLGLKATP